MPQCACWIESFEQMAKYSLGTRFTLFKVISCHKVQALAAMVTEKATMAEEAIHAWIGHTLSPLEALKARLQSAEDAQALAWLHLLEKNTSGIEPASHSLESIPSHASEKEVRLRYRSHHRPTPWKGILYVLRARSIN